MKTYMSINKLRRELPQWSWSAASRGYAGWSYDGTHGTRIVTVKAYGLLGMFEDDEVTEWRVVEGRDSVSYYEFLSKETAESVS
jgi:hypothetical protein